MPWISKVFIPGDGIFNCCRYHVCVPPPNCRNCSTITLKTVGATTTPLAMIVIGIALSGISVKSVFTEIRLYPYVIIKQIMLPLLAWAILKNVIVNPYLLGIIIVIIAMPVATSSVLFANRYENNVALATKGVFITTLASVITIPLISYLLM